MRDSKKDTGVYNRLLDSVGEGEGGRFGRMAFFFFLMWTISKVFVEFVTILLLFYILVFLAASMWDLNSSTRD